MCSGLTELLACLPACSIPSFVTIFKERDELEKIQTNQQILDEPIDDGPFLNQRHQYNHRINAHTFCNKTKKEKKKTTKRHTKVNGTTKWRNEYSREYRNTQSYSYYQSKSRALSSLSRRLNVVVVIIVLCVLLYVCVCTQPYE